MIVRLHIGIEWAALTRPISDVLLGAGFITMAVVLWSLGDTILYQKTQADRFDALIQAPPSAKRVPSSSPGAEDLAEQPILRLIPMNHIDPALIGRIEIPRLGLVAMVREGLDASTLRRAVGHMPGSAMPGQPGNFVVAGHRDSFFRGLRSVRTGDEILVRTRNGVFSYHVRTLSVVNPNDAEAVQPTVDRVCTLVTCFPFNYIGPAPRRFIVKADLTTP